MREAAKYWVLIAAISLATPACAAPLKASGEPSGAAYKPGDDGPEKPVNNNIVPLNERFQTLDDYLAFRKSRAAIDGSWYREIRPGVYRLETGNYHGPEAEKRIFTREELARKYGFSK